MMTTSNTGTTSDEAAPVPGPGPSTLGGLTLGREEQDAGTNNVSEPVPQMAPAELIADDADLPFPGSGRTVLQGQQVASVASAAARSSASMQRELELIVDDAGPAPPVATSDAAAVECPTVKKRAGAPGLETLQDCEEPPLSTDAAAADMYDSSFDRMQKANSDEPNPLSLLSLPSAPSPLNEYDNFFTDDEVYGKKIPANSPTEETVCDVIQTAGEDFEEELVTTLQPGASVGLSSEHSGDTRPEVDDTLQTTLSNERGNPSIHIPEAWAVTDSDTFDEGGDDQEVIVATHIKPMLPWWKQTQNRLYTWVMLCFFSATALTAYKTNPDHAMYQKKLEYHSFHGWNSFFTACSSVSLSLSALASLAHVSLNNVLSRWFVGTIFEGATSLFIGLTWAGSLMLITDSTQYLAMSWLPKTCEDAEVADLQASINDGSLYFSCWGAIICATVLFWMYMGEQRSKILKCFKVNISLNGMGLGYTMKWIFLVFSSFVVIAESNWYRLMICEDRYNLGEFLGYTDIAPEDITCKRNIFGLVTGYIGIVVSFFMSLCSYIGRDSSFITTIIGFSMVVNSIVCAGVLCFGHGPATTAGNQFFSAWAGVLVSLSLFGGALKEYLNSRDSPSLTDVNVEGDQALISQMAHE